MRSPDIEMVSNFGSSSQVIHPEGHTKTLSLTIVPCPGASQTIDGEDGSFLRMNDCLESDAPLNRLEEVNQTMFCALVEARCPYLPLKGFELDATRG